MTNFFTDSEGLKQEFLQFFSEPKRIVITSHQNPDGDAYGSSLGLCHVLKALKHDVTIVSPTDHAQYLAWMPGVDQIVNYEGDDHKKAISLIDDAEAIFCLDFSVLDRAKDMKEILSSSKAVKIMVDHHQEPENFAKFNFWNDKAAATCELLFLMFEKLNWQSHVSKESAVCLYTGILTDTGSFKFNSTSSEIHRIAGELLSRGVSPSEVNRALFDNQTVERLRFLGFALSEKMVHLPDLRLVYFVFTEEDLKKFNSQKGDTEGVVNYGLSIGGVILSAIFIEKDGMVKISFRSVGDFSVSDFSRKYFNGGGHKNAAGGRDEMPVKNVEQKFLNLISNYRNQLLAQPA